MDETRDDDRAAERASGSGDRGARALRDPARDRRPGPDAGAGARVPALRRPPADRGRARPREDADDQDRRRGARRHVPPHPVHARPRAERPRRHARLPPRHGDVRHGAGPGVLQLPPRRRDQPRARQGAVGAARGDAGAPGDDRPRDDAGARSVPRHGDAEPDRVRGHVPAARGAGRPVHAEGRRRLPRAGGRADRRRAGARGARRGARGRHSRASSPRSARR